MFKKVLAILLLGFTANICHAINVSNDMMDMVKLLGPSQNLIEQAYGIGEQIMTKSALDPRILAAMTQWKVLAPQITTMAQQCMTAMAEIMTKGVNGMDYSKVTPQVQNFMKAMEPMAKSMGSMFGNSNPLGSLMNSPINPMKMFNIGKK